MTARPTPPAFPQALDDDHDDVAWALQTAGVEWRRGAFSEALQWIERAVEAAIDAAKIDRARNIQAQANAIDAALKAGWIPSVQPSVPPGAFPPPGPHTSPRPKASFRAVAGPLSSSPPSSGKHDPDAPLPSFADQADEDYFDGVEPIARESYGDGAIPSDSANPFDDPIPFDVESLRPDPEAADEAALPASTASGQPEDAVLIDAEEIVDEEFDAADIEALSVGVGMSEPANRSVEAVSEPPEAVERFSVPELEAFERLSSPEIEPLERVSLPEIEPLERLSEPPEALERMSATDLELLAEPILPAPSSRAPSEPPGDEDQVPTLHPPPMAPVEEIAAGAAAEEPAPAEESLEALPAVPEPAAPPSLPPESLPPSALEEVTADEPAAEPADEPAAEPADEPAAEPADEPAAEPPAVEGPVDLGGVLLSEVRGLEDLPEESQAALARQAEVYVLGPDEEVGGFGLALILEGAVMVMPTVADVAVATAARGELVFAEGHLEEGVALRVVAASEGARVATWPVEAFAQAITECPWVGDELRNVGDRYQALAGITMGKLGEHLDDMLRSMVVERCEVRRLLPGEIIAEAGKPVRGMFLIGAGRVEVVNGDTVEAELGPGEFLFASQILAASSAPAGARSGPGGALVLFANRMAAHELMVSVPPLLEIFAS